MFPDLLTWGQGTGQGGVPPLGRHVLGLVLPLHGIGGAKDLPISPELALSAGSAALLVSFSVLGLAWRTPRFDAGTQGRAVQWLQRIVESTPWQAVTRTFGLLFTAYVGVAALAGPDLVINPVFGVVYSWLWVGLIPASLLFGPVVRQLSPLRTLHLVGCRLLSRDPGRGLLRLPPAVGCWPAAVGLLAFTWLELASPDSTSLDAVRGWFLGYAVLVGGGAVLLGDRWFAAADPFECYSTLVGHLSVFGRRTDGALVVRSPLRNLDGVVPVPGLAARAPRRAGRAPGHGDVHPPTPNRLTALRYLRDGRATCTTPTTSTSGASKPSQGAATWSPTPTSTPGTQATNPIPTPRRRPTGTSATPSPPLT